MKPYLNAEWSKPNVDCSGRHKPKIMKNGVLVPQESDGQDNKTAEEALNDATNVCVVCAHPV